MKNRMKFYWLIGLLSMSLLACGKTENDVIDTEYLTVGAGLSFESEEGEVVENTVFMEMVLTAADLEGMTEQLVKARKHADIYANPSKESSTIGAVDADMEIGVYGLTEDSKWMVVSYNGRIGYVEAEVFGREVVDAQEVIVPTTPVDRNTTITDNSNTGAFPGGENDKPAGGAAPSGRPNYSGGESNSNNENNSGGTSNSGSGTGDSQEKPEGAGDNNTGNTDSGNIEEPSGSESEFPSGSEAETPSESESEVPSESESQTPSESESQTPSESESEVPSESESQTPSESESESPSEGESESSSESESETTGGGEASNEGEEPSGLLEGTEE